MSEYDPVAQYTNYFRVKDAEVFSRILAKIPDIEVEAYDDQKGTGKFENVVRLRHFDDRDNWPTWDDDDQDIYLPGIIASHLQRGSVAVFEWYEGSPLAVCDTGKEIRPTEIGLVKRIKKLTDKSAEVLQFGEE